jgi:drug/metabolite transporter (DMT)-like permease
LAVLLMAAGPFATQMTQEEDGSYAYLPVAATLSAEALKLALCAAAYAFAVPPGRRTHASVRWGEACAYAAPATIYAFNNLLLFVVVQHIRPSLFQLLSSTKTLFTALLFRALLHRRLSWGHVLSLVGLAAGAAVARLPGQAGPRMCDPGPYGPPLPGPGGSRGTADDAVTDEWWGVALTLASCAASSLGGVANERLLKGGGRGGGVAHSLWLQNGILYGGVLCLQLSSPLGFMRSDDPLPSHPFTGGGPGMLLLVSLMAATGLVISGILKRLDNIVRVLAHTGAILISMLVEGAAAGVLPPSSLCLSFVLVGSSTLSYAREPPPRPTRPSAHLLAASSMEMGEGGGGAASSSPSDEPEKGIDTPREGKRGEA